MRSHSARKLSHGRATKWDTSGILLPATAIAGSLDLESVFGNTRPVEIEVGTGKGTFLLARAAARPEVNFVGIERARAYCCYAADRLRRRGLTNVRMIQADAADLFDRCLPERSIWRVHMYFPDPWPKRRHRRRRLIQPKFIAQVRRALRLGGQLIIVTDHIGYFRQIADVLGQAKGFAIVPFPRMTDIKGELVGTNFERKYIAQGRSFYWLARMRYA